MWSWWVLIGLLTALGIVSLVKPVWIWWIYNFWRFRGEAEPSDFSLMLYRLCAIVYFIAAFAIYAVKLHAS